MRKPFIIPFLFVLFAAFSFSLSNWIFNFHSEPIGLDVSESAISVTTIKNELYSVNKEDGSLFFLLSFPTPLTNPVAYKDIIFVADATAVYALDSLTGKEKYTIPISNALRLLIHNDALVIEKDDGIFFYNPRSGSLFSHINDTDGSVSRTAFWSGYLAVASESSLSLYSTANNSLLWRVPISGGWPTSLTLTELGVVVSTTDYSLTLYSLESGKKLWQYPLQALAAGEFLKDGQLLFFGTNDGKVHCVNISSGQEVFITKVGGAVQSKPTLSSGFLLVGSNDGKLYFLNPVSGKVISSIRFGEFIQHTAISNYNLIIATGDGFLHSISLNSFCSIEEPQNDEKIGMALQRIFGKAFATNGVRDVYVSVNEGPWKKANLDTKNIEEAASWSYFFDPRPILQGPFTIVCKVVDKSGREERGLYTTIKVHRSNFAMPKPINVSAPSQVRVSTHFYVNITDEYDNPLSDFYYSWEGQEIKGSSPLLLSSSSSGTKTLTISKAGYVTKSINIAVEKENKNFQSELLLPIAILLVGLILYFKVFGKKKD